MNLLARNASKYLTKETMYYQHGRYRVEVGNDGIVQVRPGDWLSKYSAAIYNDFTTIRVFARRDKSGSPTPIRDVNLIYAGETLYHLPTYYGSFSAMEFVVPTKATPPLTDAQKKQLIQESLRRISTSVAITSQFSTKPLTFLDTPRTPSHSPRLPASSLKAVPLPPGEPHSRSQGSYSFQSAQLSISLMMPSLGGGRSECGQ